MSVVAEPVAPVLMRQQRGAHHAGGAVLASVVDYDDIVHQLARQREVGTGSSASARRRPSALDRRAVETGPPQTTLTDYSRPAAALKLQRASRITVSQILADATAPLGTRGVDVILSNNVLFTNGASLRGLASGIRFRDSFDARIENSSICGFTLDHIEFARNVQNVVQTNNTFCDRAIVCITAPPAP